MGASRPFARDYPSRVAGQADQLDQWVAMIEGREHLLPGFDEALAVQQTIEAILHSG